jgi:hypothetical protein
LNRGVGLAVWVVHFDDGCSVAAHADGLRLDWLFDPASDLLFLWLLSLLNLRGHVRLAVIAFVYSGFNVSKFLRLPSLFREFGLLLHFGLDLLLFDFHQLEVFFVVVLGDRFGQDAV